jgi:hypothetical protein
VGGILSNSGDVVTLAERWNGTSWKTQTTPNPAGAGYSQLNGVSCTSASACTAVGYYLQHLGPLLRIGRGMEWHILDDPCDR